MKSSVDWRAQTSSKLGDDSKGPLQRVKVACGHQTADVDAEEMLIEVITLFRRIIAGDVPVVSTRQVRDELCDLWRESDGSKYSVFGPRRLVDDVRKEVSRR